MVLVMKKVMCMRKNAIIPVMMFGICALGITACGNKEGSSTQEDTALDSMNYISINKVNINKYILYKKQYPINLND